MADLAKIEKALDDLLAKKLATVDEVKQLVKTELENDELQAKYATAAQLTEQQEKFTAGLEGVLKQFKALQRTGFAQMRDASGQVGGVLPRHEAKALGCFALATIANCEKAKTALEDMGFDKALFSNTTDGAYLVPAEFCTSVIELIGKWGVYRRNARNWPMSSKETSVPKQTDSLIVYCPGEGVAIPQSALGFEGVPLRPQGWKALTAISKELDEDSAIALGDLLARDFAGGFAKQEDLCGFVGDGSKTYFNNVGIATALRAVHATITSVAGFHVQGTVGNWTKISMADLVSVIGLLPDDYDDEDAKFYCSKNFYLTVMLLASIEKGYAGVRDELLRTAYTKQPTFFGRSVEFTGAMPKKVAAADHCPLLFGNLQQGAIFGDRRQLTIETSKEVGFKEDLIYIKAGERVAMNNHGVGDTSEAGPVVGLWADIA